MKYTLGHKTVIEIHPGKPMMYLGENGKNVPISFRISEADHKAGNKLIRAAIKKVRYAGSDK